MAVFVGGLDEGQIERRSRGEMGCSLTRLRRYGCGSLPISPAAAPLVLARLSCAPKPPATQATTVGKVVKSYKLQDILGRHVTHK